MRRRLPGVLFLTVGVLAAAPLGARADESGGASAPVDASGTRTGTAPAAAPPGATVAHAPAALRAPAAHAPAARRAPVRTGAAPARATPAVPAGSAVPSRATPATASSSAPASEAASAVTTADDTIQRVPPPPRSAPSASGQTLPGASEISALPSTGGRPEYIGALGLGLILMGAGLRLRMLARSRYRIRVRALL